MFRSYKFYLTFFWLILFSAGPIAYGYFSAFGPEWLTRVGTTAAASPLLMSTILYMLLILTFASVSWWFWFDTRETEREARIAALAAKNLGMDKDYAAMKEELKEFKWAADHAFNTPTAWVKNFKIEGEKDAKAFYYLAMEYNRLKGVAEIHRSSPIPLKTLTRHHGLKKD